MLSFTRIDERENPLAIGTDVGVVKIARVGRDQLGGVQVESLLINRSLVVTGREKNDGLAVRSPGHGITGRKVGSKLSGPEDARPAALDIRQINGVLGGYAEKGKTLVVGAD